MKLKFFSSIPDSPLNSTYIGEINKPKDLKRLNTFNNNILGFNQNKCNQREM